MSHTPIACIRILRFAVEAERRRRTDSARLVLIGDATVYDCSLGAETLGVRRGQRMSEAIGLCTQAITLPPDTPYYERTFEEVLDALDGVSPVVEPAGTGTAFLSLAGIRDDLQEIGDQVISGLHRRTRFMASAGIADSKFVARVAASIVPPGAARLVPSGSERDFLAPLPVSHLPAGEATLWRMQLLGIDTIGDIARMPPGAVQAQFGPEGKRCWDLASGHDGEPLVPRRKEEAIVRRLQMAAPATTIDAILIGIERLLREAYADRRRNNRPVRKAVVRATLDAGGAWELPVTFREAIAGPDAAWIAVKAAVMRHPPDQPVEEIEVELAGLGSESGKQASMFDGKGKLWRQVEEALKQLQAQRRAPPVGKIAPLEPWSRIPERRAALVERQGDV